MIDVNYELVNMWQVSAEGMNDCIDMIDTYGDTRDSELHWHHALEMMLMIEGSVTYTANCTSRKCDAGDIYLINSQTIHKGENSTDAELRADEILTRLMLICIQLAGEKKGAAVYEGIREALNEELGKAAPTVEGIKEALIQRYGADFDSLDEFFSKRYGISIEGYAVNRMLNKAKELLRFTIKPMQEVISESGIGSEEKLRSLFMENENMSPEDYRKKWAQWIKG